MENASIDDVKRALQTGNSSLAMQLAQQQLATDITPEQRHELLYTLGVAQRLNGQHQAAMATITTLLEHQPEYARAHQEMGYLHLASNNIISAIIAFLNATKLNPALLSAWNKLKTLYQQIGNHDAVKLTESQIQYLQSLPAELRGARDLMHEAKYFTADTVCRRYLQTHKHDAEAMLLLAEIGIRLKIYHDAEFLLESCLTLHPNFTRATAEYIQLLSKLGKFSKAKQVAEQQLTNQPDNIQFLAAKASAMVGVGEIEQSIELYQSILAKHPNLVGIHLLAGHAHKAFGEFDAAVKAYQKVYQLKPEFGDAYWSLANTKTYRFNDSELAAMKQLVDEKQGDTNDRIHILFALGKAYEDQKAYDTSFNYYRAGNSLKNQLCRYDQSYLEQQVEAQKRSFTAQLFAAKSGFGDDSTAPIFIVGLPRAGSTLLEQILASHSLVDGTMELHNILGLVSRLGGKKGLYPAMIEELDSDYLAKFGKQYIEETRGYRKQAPFFIDKMPNNFMHIGLIKLILPNAKVIDARRDPMACCFSGFKQLFAEGQEFTYDLANLAHYYQQYQQIMAHWDSVLPGFVLRVQHEDVVDDLETQVRRILDFCDLPFEQSCIEFYKTKRSIKTPSSEQVRQPIYKTAVEQWKNYQSHLPQLIDVFKAHDN